MEIGLTGRPGAEHLAAMYGGNGHEADLLAGLRTGDWLDGPDVSAARATSYLVSFPKG